MGTASDVTMAMELGVDGVLLNTGIAHAKDPLRMARAMRLACESGRLAYLAGRIPKKLYATASSPLEGTISPRRNSEPRAILGRLSSDSRMWELIEPSNCFGPVGAFDNSPAVHCWEGSTAILCDKSRRDGRIEQPKFGRPYGTKMISLFCTRR